MPIETSIDKKTGVIIRKVTAELTFGEIKSSFEKSFKYPGFRKNMPVIWDLRDTDVTMIYEEDINKIINILPLCPSNFCN